MMRAKSSSNPAKIRLTLNKKLNHLKKLIGQEKELRLALLRAKLPINASAIQTDIQDTIRTVKLVTSAIKQLQARTLEPEIVYFHTPIENTKPVNLPKIPKLTQNQLNSIDTIRRSPDWKSGLVTPKELMLLKEYDPSVETPGDYWLNDNVITQYIGLLLKYSTNIFVVDSLISEKIRSGDLVNGQRPSAAYRKKKLLKNTILLFPVKYKDHWTLVIWNAKLRTLTHFDSLNTPTEEFLAPFQMYLIERRIHEGEPPNFLTGLKRIIEPLPESLKQTNVVDCGIYILLFARSIIQGFPFTFYQRQMNHLRSIIAYELIIDELITFF